MISRRTQPRNAWLGRPGGGISLALLLVGLLMVGPGYAYAEEGHGEESTMANVLVLQAISLIANGAPTDAVAERIQDALQAPDPTGTDLTLVAQALDLVEQGSPGASGAADLDQARDLLVRAIDIRYATGYGAVPEPGEVAQGQPPYASGADTGTTVVLDGLEPARGISDRADVVLLILGVLAVAAGLFLARRWRPHSSIRVLRHATPKSEESS